MQSKLKRIARTDWDAVAGIVAALVALLMHLLHVIEQDVLLAIALVLLALLFIRHLRLERRLGDTAESVARIETTTGKIQNRLQSPDVTLLGPADLRTKSEMFSSQASGEMIWFHICLSMFRSQLLFDKLLRPAIENPRVKAIRFTLDSSQKALWKDAVAPKVRECDGYEKIQDPTWTTIRENVSFIMAGQNGVGECLLSFWGEPFMSQIVGSQVPRYIFQVEPNSELVTHLAELERVHRIGAKT